jgi:hypothetical protein
VSLVAVILRCVILAIAQVDTGVWCYQIGGSVNSTHRSRRLVFPKRQPSGFHKFIPDGVKLRDRDCGINYL